MTTNELTGRVALVTGGSRGIGRASCLALAENGALVAVHYRVQSDAANEVVAQIISAGGKAIAIQADVTDNQQITGLVEQTVAHFGHIDILVNNAGEMASGPIESMSDEMWERALTVNLTAPFRLIRACIPIMKVQQWGRIINLSSQVAYTGSINNAHYAAAKSGLLGLTFSLAKELAPYGITVNVVSPGRIVTDMIAGSIEKRQEEWLKQTPLRRLGEPEEVASAVAFLASASYITGANLHVNGGLVMG